MTRLDTERLLTTRATRVIVCTGAGGVGKTTTSAALAVRAAEMGRQVVVLTIDPARRLAQALGIEGLTNTPQEVDLSASDAGDADSSGDSSAPESGGRLYAMMLDMKGTFDELVAQNSTPERAERIMANPFYKTLVESFAGTQEYMAMEKLGQLLEDSSWDLVIVDTPPSRNALDFLDAPARLAGFMDSRLMRMLAAPGRGFSRLASGAMSAALKGISRIVGSAMLSDASEFVQALDSTFGGFATRAARTQAVLRRRGTEFVVVATAEAPALREAGFFVDRLTEEGMPLAGVVINRTHPRLVELGPDEATAGARRVAGDYPETAAALDIHTERALTAREEVRLISGFTKQRPSVPIVGVPSLPFEVSSLTALRALGSQLVGQE